MPNYNKISLENSARSELKESLNLTGCEISANRLPAGMQVPFYHAHKQNEEVYLIISGEGFIELDKEKVALRAGDALRVAPSVVRKVYATSDLYYFCIQAKENSLTQWTHEDGFLVE